LEGVAITGLNDHGRMNTSNPGDVERSVSKRYLTQEGAILVKQATTGSLDDFGDDQDFKLSTEHHDSV
jgi:hypothetical protein